jgi:HAD superfamily hydrolase (TIGR01490 family)
MVALFDLDRTLIDTNSGRLWMQSELRAGRIGVFDALWASYWLVRYSVGMEGGLDRAFEQAAMSLKGETVGTIDDRTRVWFEAEVRHRLRPGALKALEQHRLRGDRCVIATSASIYEARYAAMAWGLEPGVHTTFEVEDGVFTGQIERSALGAAKLERVREWAKREGVDLKQASFYSDSHTDLPVFEAVGRPVAVHPDRKLAALAAERGWPVADWGVAKAG